MRILVVSQYFWPENFSINALTKTLRDKGHSIVIATGKPNYPEGKIYQGYQSSGTQKELFDDNIEVVRVPLRPRGKSGGLALFLNYISFVWSGLRWFPVLLKDHSFDAILVFAGSPNVAIPAIPLRKIKNAHLAIWVLDLWPESLSATGFIKNKVILKLIGYVVKWTYACADTILVQSKAFIAPVAVYTNRNKIVYYANSVQYDEYHESIGFSIPSELLDVLKSNFCIVFTGNIGTAQAIGTLVEAAELLKNLSEVKIVIVGSGSMLEWLSNKKQELGLDNLIIAGRFPPECIPEICKHAAGLVVTLKNEEIFSYTIPNKIQAYLAAGKPIIAAINGEGARIIEEAGVGLSSAAEDAQGLADCIKQLYILPEADRIKMGEAGKSFFLKNFEMNQQVDRLIEILEERMKPIQKSHTEK